MGAFEAYKYKMIESPISQNMSLYFFTDGIFEEFNENKEEFGLERMEKIVISGRNKPLEEVMNSVLLNMTDFLNNTPIVDDITFIGVRLV